MRSVKASEVVRRAIRASGLSLNELGRRTGVESGALSRFVRGERGIGLTTFEALAKELGLSVTPQTPLYLWVFSVWESLSLRRVLDVSWHTEAGVGHLQLNDPGLLPRFIKATEADGRMKWRGKMRGGESPEMALYDTDEATLVEDLAKLLAKSSLDGVSRTILTVRSLAPEQLVERLEAWRAAHPLKRWRVAMR